MKDKFYSVGSSKTKITFTQTPLVTQEDFSGKLYVFDENTFRLFPESDQLNSVVLPPGEGAKNWKSIDLIAGKALESGMARDSVFVGVGGGVVCDLTAAAASLYMRGSGLVLVPTTLLAMCDASLGGKTGFDYKGYKNILGTFYPAEEIRISVDVLKHLPVREFKSGLAEVIKHGFLSGDTDILDLLTSDREKILARDPGTLERIAASSLDVKGWYVENDFKEENLRRHLNLGHTFAHALESVTGFSSVSHGEAVAWGILMALRAGAAMGETDPSWLEEADRILSLYGYRTDYHAALPVSEIIEAMNYDKKKKDGEVRFVLQHRRGDTFTAPVDREILEEVFGS